MTAKDATKQRSARPGPSQAPTEAVAPIPPVRALGEIVQGSKHRGWVVADDHDLVLGKVTRSLGPWGGSCLVQVTVNGKALDALEGRLVAILPVVTEDGTPVTED